MTSQQTLTQALTGVVANTDYSEAVLRLADGTEHLGELQLQLKEFYLVRRQNYYKKLL